MRRSVLLGLGVLALGGDLAGCQKKAAEPARAGEVKAAAAGSSAPVGPPHRKPGLWVQTMQVAGRAQTVRMCLDADTEAKMAIWGQAMGKDQCSTNTMTPVAGGWSFRSVCNLGSAGHVVSEGTAVGDFNSRYKVKVRSVTTGAAMPQANGTHEMTLDAAYGGACPPGMKGGDINMAVPGMKGGMTINLEKMAAVQR